MSLMLPPPAWAWQLRHCLHSTSGRPCPQMVVVALLTYTTASLAPALAPCLPSYTDGTLANFYSSALGEFNHLARQAYLVTCTFDRQRNVHSGCSSSTARRICLLHQTYYLFHRKPWLPHIKVALLVSLDCCPSETVVHTCIHVCSVLIVQSTPQLHCN